MTFRVKRGDYAGGIANLRRVIELRRDELTLRVDEYARFTLRRGERTVLRDGEVWVADGTANDRFVALTEGVIPGESLGFPERPVRATSSPATSTASRWR